MRDNRHRASKISFRRRIAAGVTVLGLLFVGTAAFDILATPVQEGLTAYQCYAPNGSARSSIQLFPPSQPSTQCRASDVLKKWAVQNAIPGTVTTTTVQSTTTSGATTTTAAPTTTTQPATTTTQPGGTPAFLSRPAAACGTRLSGSNVNFSNRTIQGCSNGVALTVSNATNVTLTGLDFANNVGDIYLVDVTGNVSISGIRARNTGDGTIGSGHSNVIQLSRTWDNDPAVDIWNVKAYGGNTEDVISIYQSGGMSATNTLLIEDVHIEHPLSGALAWSSDSSTCINLADSGGKNTTVRNSTFLNCGQVGLQMNEPEGGNVKYIANKVYGAQRPDSNVGASQWSSGNCSVCADGNEFRDNRIWWKNLSGSNNALWLSDNFPVADINNVKMDPTLNPDTSGMRVVL